MTASNSIAGVHSRLDTCFAQLQQQGRKALIPFITAGDPHPDLTVDLMHALVRGGADILELGVPFSDPMADGPVIQRASERALAHGVNLGHVFDMVKQFRQQDAQTPVVLMGYLNPLEAMGYARFAQAAQAAGVDGMLTVDCPPEECADLAQALEQAGLAPIFLVSPTTPEHRILALSQWARGYVYYVSLNGVTGASHLNLDDVAQRMQVLRQHIRLPIGVGFGIREPETAARVAGLADAVVIGSRIVQEVETQPSTALAAALEALLKPFRQAMDA